MTDKERAVDWVIKNGASCLQNNMTAYEFAEQAYLAGFNADKWHYPSKGESPDKDGKYFILREYRGKLFPDIANYSVKRGWLGIITIPYAWQHIVLPQERV